MTRRLKLDLLFGLAFLGGVAVGFVHGLRSEPEILADREFDQLHDEGAWG